LEAQWTPESSEGNCRGQNSFDGKIHYVMGKLLKGRYLKWACMTHLGFLKHMLWPKEGLGIKLIV
jgi:hypothetical protein